MDSISVLIVDDHPIMREALANAIHAEPDLTVAGEAVNGDQALRRYQELRPNVVLMDLLMPLRDGVAATADILAFDPQARILVLTSVADDSRVLAALVAGALGYVTKDAERSQIIAGLRQVAAGQTFLPPSTASKLVRALQHGAPVAPTEHPPTALTLREQEVLTLAAAGWNDGQIADRLTVSTNTVRVHIHHIIEKLAVADRSQAVEWHRTQNLT